MIPLNISAQNFAHNLTATKSMSATAAVILAVTLVPMSGGAIKPYELREFRAGVAALMNGEHSTPQLTPARYPHRSGVVVGAARGTALNRGRLVSAAAQPADAVELAGLVDSGDVTPIAYTFEDERQTCADCILDEPGSPPEEAGLSALVEDTETERDMADNDSSVSADF